MTINTCNVQKVNANRKNELMILEGTYGDKILCILLDSGVNHSLPTTGLGRNQTSSLSTTAEVFE